MTAKKILIEIQIKERIEAWSRHQVMPFTIVSHETLVEIVALEEP